jgi:hypothetical protein
LYAFGSRIGVELLPLGVNLEQAARLRKPVAFGG